MYQSLSEMFSAWDTQRAQVPEWSNGSPQVLFNILGSLTEAVHHLSMERTWHNSNAKCFGFFSFTGMIFIW